MKIEKLNENKIRVTFNNTDLERNNLDIHSFMANSIESQNLFLNILDEAEKEVGFITDNYKLSIESIALSGGIFIVTVTKLEKEILKSTRVQARRKSNLQPANILIYKFSNFDDFCNFENFLSQSFPKYAEYFSNSNSLYKYSNYFFLVLENLDNKFISSISAIISEFAVCIDNTELIVSKLKEYGNLIKKQSLHNT